MLHHTDKIRCTTQTILVSSPRILTVLWNVPITPKKLYGFRMKMTAVGNAVRKITGGK